MKNLSAAQLHYARYIAPVRMAMKRRGNWSSYQANKRTRRARSKRRRFTKRRGGRRSGRRSGITTRIAKTPFPDRMFTVLYYRDLKQLSVPSGGFPIEGVPYQTSIYDPQASLGGHKPLWTTQLEGIYSKYRVHGIKYRIKCCNTNTSQLGWLYALQSTQSYAYPNNINSNTLSERRLCQRRSCTANTNPTVIKGYMPTGRPWGLTKQEMKGDEDFEADVGSNPTKQSFLNLFVESMHTSAIFNVEVELKVFVEFFNRKEVAGS